MTLDYLGQAARASFGDGPAQVVKQWPDVVEVATLFKQLVAAVHVKNKAPGSLALLLFLDLVIAGKVKPLRAKVDWVNGKVTQER